MFNINFTKRKPNQDNNNILSPQLAKVDTTRSSDENSDPITTANRVVTPIPSILDNEHNSNINVDDEESLMDTSLQHTPKKRISELDFMSDSGSLPPIGDEFGPQELPDQCKTKNIGLDSISILTLNRTLAFIEATARCLGEHLFASTIIRCCNQKLIPFYGAHKSLPSGMNLNYLDLPMFRKIRPPSPIQLTSAASLLIHKIYRDKLPIMIPVPSFDEIIEGLLVDMNLPKDLRNHMNKSVTFATFRQTRPTEIVKRSRSTQLPQYDRWAFVILLCQLKKLFGLNDQSIADQKECAKKVAKETNQKNNCFIVLDWIKQLSIKLQLIMSYDPFVLFHPMTNIKNLQPNSQLYKYIDTVLDDTVTAQTKITGRVKYDSNYRSELSDFFARHVPKPEELENRIISEEQLDKPVDHKHPIKDSFLRTQRFWASTVAEHPRICKLLSENYADYKVVVGKNVETWSIYAEQLPGNMKFEVLPTWPYCFKLLLSVGAFICYCEPRELLREFKFVEEYLYPELAVQRKRLSRAQSRYRIQ